jgi:spoIIIJ-associated protein
MEEKIMGGKTVEEAIELALRELEASREEAEVEILSRGKAGFLGIGTEPAKVRVRKLTSSPIASLAVETVDQILGKSGVQTLTTLRTGFDPDTKGPSLAISGVDAGLLIGRRGDTLRTLQFIVNLIVRKKLNDASVRITLDIEEYRERRNRSLKELAMRVATRVASNGVAISLEPMPASERRIIHVTLGENSKVTTESNGFGSNRRITVSPKKT